MVLYHNGHVLMECREEEALRGLFAFLGGKEECCDDGHLHHTAQREIREELHVDAEAAVDSAEDYYGDYFVRTYLARRPVTTPDYLRLRQRNMLGHVLQWFSLSEVRELVRRDQVTPSSLPIVGSSRFDWSTHTFRIIQSDANFRKWCLSPTPYLGTCTAVVRSKTKYLPIPQST